ncbi:MAG: lipocalin-like domain-containing protein [Prevotellaceae bacterium]|nr:lipocalin-like domain-containing protein [Prevotellaceae bacterium]
MVTLRKMLYLLAGITLLMLTACSKSADLEQKWQLRQYVYANGETAREDSLFYNFQKGSFSAICLLPTGSYHTFFGNYTHTNDELSIVLLPESSSDENYSRYIGWENAARTFRIETLSETSLQLAAGGTHYLFRSY